MPCLDVASWGCRSNVRSSVAVGTMLEITEIVPHIQEDSGVQEDFTKTLEDVTVRKRLCLKRLGEALVLARKVEAAIGSENTAACTEQF